MIQSVPAVGSLLLRGKVCSKYWSGKSRVYSIRYRVSFQYIIAVKTILNVRKRLNLISIHTIILWMMRCRCRSCCVVSLNETYKPLVLSYWVTGMVAFNL